MNRLFTYIIRRFIVLAALVPAITILYPEKTYAAKFFQEPEAMVIRGVVKDSTGLPLPGVSIQVKGGLAATATDQNGKFVIANVGLHSVVRFFLIGYDPEEIIISSNKELQVILMPSVIGLKEVAVVSTGYQLLPRERATGSFSSISGEQFERHVAPDILSRIEGVSNAVLFDKRDGDISSGKVSVRGMSSIFSSKAALIVLDNFPYEGDISNINPNDVESITVLKDAAAASIWGAKAGNGVIVITTKSARYNRKLRTDFSTSFTVGSKPDATQIPYMSSADFIDVERELFDRGFYKNDEQSSAHPVLSPVVELLIKKRDNLMPASEADAHIDSLRLNDVRNDYSRYLYQRSISQQHSLSIRGGSTNVSYLMSAGYDNNIDNLDNKNQRLSLRTENRWTVIKGLEAQLGGIYSRSTTVGGRSPYLSISSGSKSIYPYARFADEEGNFLPIAYKLRSSFTAAAEAAGLLNWEHRPLQEFALTNNRSGLQTAILNTGLRYQIAKGLKADLTYQYASDQRTGKELQSVDSYLTRDYINSFTQTSGGKLVRPVPVGDILNLHNTDIVSQSGRAQVNYSRTAGRSIFSGLAGMEVRERKLSSSGSRTYGYNENTLTFTPVNYDTYYPQYFYPGFQTTIPSGPDFSGITNRFVSWYGNASYTYNNKYTVSVSGRKDGSNLFGVKTNQRIVPLGSAGLSWLVSQEPFFNVSWLPYLKLRGTYGVSGNTDNSLTAYTTIRYVSASGINNTPYAVMSTPPNPSLRWEKVRMVNIGADIASLGDRIRGSIELYFKKGNDLIGLSPVDPTTGVAISTVQFGYRGNVADMYGKGVDLELHLVNLNRRLKWNTSLFFSYNKDEITGYKMTPGTANNYAGAGLGIAPLVGKPVYSLLSYRWAGLDPQTGDPRGYVNGEISKDYTAMTRGASVEDLVYHGPALPPYFGSVLNSFSFRNMSISANITYRAGHYFRRNSINYGLLFDSWNGHSDYALRWQKPGDELKTSVPSMVYPSNSGRDAFYTMSEATVEKADNIRLKDIRISYSLERSMFRHLPLQKIQLYAYSENLGFIWKASRYSTDPDTGSDLSLPKTFSLGLRANF